LIPSIGIAGCTYRDGYVRRSFLDDQNSKSITEFSGTGGKPPADFNFNSIFPSIKMGQVISGLVVQRSGFLARKK